ncbi:protein kinase domain-containing protein [Nocardiopsis metallicus]|uniref:non-specific serine/threonine protein kinase n=1 Tax=Nocardiopsis metallicus TaxID=179819 RepID=A0A840WGP2_9ACTN|nr:protein kinase [Nocardiopsis metallicus]MBB5489228.1 serine/threonine protein kinase [Nocardiopsis metallicus]
MVTPDPGDENAPTQRIDPTPPTTRVNPAVGATRWVTRVFRPGASPPPEPHPGPGGPPQPQQPGPDEAPTRIVPPGPPTGGGHPNGSDRTTVLPGGAARPGNGADGTRVQPPASPTARLDANRPAQRPATGGAPGPGAPGSPEGRTPWWRTLFGPLLDWMARLLSRVVVGPAGDLDYAVPAELRRRYQVLDHIGAGGEAVVYLAEPTDSPGRRLALKVYRPGHDINRELLDRLRARGTASPYTPAIQGYGTATSSWGEDLAWEAQEYFSLGTLREVINQSPMDDERARAVVRAVADCLHHWQSELQHNHTDVKPENLLVRSLDPPVVALTDFGGAVRATMSRVYGGQAITEDYAAPEVVEGRREAPASWWSLGVMVHELTTGRRPERGGNWLTARNTEVDISAITDERWRLLARGLLTLAPSARWGYDEVAAWLAGERPPIRTANRLRPINFAGAFHEDPPSLAFDLLDRSDTGAMWLRSHWSELRTWLDREVNDYTFDRAYLTGLDTRPDLAHVAISALAARYVPGMPPRFRGHEISADGLLSLATGEASRHAVVREAVESGVVGLGAQHWCPHPGCRSGGSGRCALLERVQHEVPLLMRRVEETLDRVVGPGAWGTGDTDAPQRPAAHEMDSAWARAVELVLVPETASQHRSLLRRQSWHPSQRSAAPNAPWWLEQRKTALRDGGDQLASRSAMLTALLLLPEADRVGGAIAERERADGRERRRDRWASLAGSARARWESTREKVATAKQRRAEAATTRPEQRAVPGGRVGPGGQRVPGDPTRPQEPATAKEKRRQDKAERRVQRTMGQIQRAMKAGKCRRFAYPAALLGMVDGLGRALRPEEGFFPESVFVTDAYTGLIDFSGNPLADGAAALTGLLPGGIGASWWFPVLLSVVLVVLGRTAAKSTVKARRRLGAFRLAVAGSLLMLVVLFSTGLLALGSGVLIPLDGLLG